MPKPRKNNIIVTENSMSMPIYASQSHGRAIYQVAVYDGPGAKRKLKSFSDLQAAKDFARRLLQGRFQDRLVMAKLTAEQIENACLLAEHLLPFTVKLGISLRQAIEEYIAARTLAGSRGLVACVRAHVEQPWLTRSKIRFYRAAVHFLRAKKAANRHPNTINKLRYALRRIARTLGNPPLDTITTTNLNPVICRPDLQPIARRTVYRALTNFYGWLKRNRYLEPGATTPLDGVETITVRKGTVSVLDVPTTRHALQTVAADPYVHRAAFFAIGLFSGLRMCDLAKLSWCHIQAAGIHLPSSITKTDSPRFIPMNPALQAWLAPFLGLAKGKIASAERSQHRIAELLKTVGIPWQRNCLRHSFSSYRLAVLGDCNQTKAETGNSLPILERHYHRATAKEKAQAYFALTPEACGVTDWPERVRRYLEGRNAQAAHAEKAVSAELANQ